MDQVKSNARVVLPSGASVCSLLAGSFATVAELKTHIEALEGTPVRSQILLVGTEVLADDERIPWSEGLILTLTRLPPPLLLASRSSNMIWIFDARDGSVVKKMKHNNLMCVALSPGGAWVAAGNNKGGRIVDLATGDVLQWPGWEKKGPPKANLSTGGKEMSALAFSRDGGRLVTASSDNTARIIDTSTGIVLHEIKHHRSCACFSADGSFIATGMEDGKARIVDATTGVVVNELEHGKNVYSMAFSSSMDGYLATGCDGKTRIFALPSCSLVQEIVEPGNPACAMAFSSDGRLLATPNGVYALDGETWTVRPEFKVFQEGDSSLRWSHSACFSPNDEVLAVARGGTVYISAVSTGEILHQMGAIVGFDASSVSFSPP